MLKQLELEHKVDLNAPVTKYLPWFKTDKEITIKDLMLHKVDYTNTKLQQTLKLRSSSIIYSETWN